MKLEDLKEKLKNGIKHYDECFESCHKEDYFDRILYKNISMKMKIILNDLNTIENE